MKKIKKYLTAIVVSFILFAAFWFYLFGLFQSPMSFKIQSVQNATQEQQKQESNKLNVDFGNDEKIDYSKEFSSETTAFSILQDASTDKNFPLEVKTYDFGVFVQSINDYESTAEKSWIYFVNGQGGQVAADQYKLNPGDYVEWKYIAPKGE